MDLFAPQLCLVEAPRTFHRPRLELLELVHSEPAAELQQNQISFPVTSGLSWPWKKPPGLPSPHPLQNLLDGGVLCRVTGNVTGRDRPSLKAVNEEDWRLRDKALQLSDQMLNQTTLHSSIKDIVTELLKEAILANMENSKGFLIDGYPQEIQHGELFENEIGEPSLVLCMDCSSKTMSSRLLQKSQCLEDNIETIMKCIEAYYKTAEPLIAYYENRIPVFKINAEGTPEEVFLEICTSVNTFLKE
ncbi:PREDICTED: adenylate kinase-like [Thamnophis sirtalis]|uniref:Adenylate kinase-like n=1 Tax=Thamnophis sirtalis TaxID=35019 RepID=A0A6I9YKH3_9SAUR|nr:PREDICTED: adenylate kinase-like [Thamnophis sirtalis]